MRAKRGLNESRAEEGIVANQKESAHSGSSRSGGRGSVPLARVSSEYPLPGRLVDLEVLIASGHRSSPQLNGLSALCALCALIGAGRIVRCEGERRREGCEGRGECWREC